MARDSISIHIIEAIKEEAGDDELMLSFLNKLLYEQIQHSSQWQYKTVYRNELEKFTKMRGRK